MSTTFTGELSSSIGESQLLSLLLESPYEGIIFVDTEGVIRYVNESFAKYNRLSKEDLIGHNYNEFNIDPYLKGILETKQYEPLSYFFMNNRSHIVSRRPVYDGKTLAGVYARYFSVDSKDVNKKFGAEYEDLISGIHINDIVINLKKSIMELNAYKDDYARHQPTKGIDSIIGESPAMRSLKSSILRVCNSPSSVLITGDSGTGKELVAQALHYHGERCSKPFIKVNCAAIPDTLLESELFGYCDGAFTGARKGGKMGKFELANKGTIFLDEIGDMSLVMQAKLLRVLQEREFERIGGESSISVDVRVIAATNRNILAMVEENTFREDLYYRLNILNFHLPPLRHRSDDIPLIVKYIIGELNNKLGASITKITPEAMSMLTMYKWPGNVRELVNALESAMNYSGNSWLEADDLWHYKAKIDVSNQTHSAERNQSSATLQSQLEKVEKQKLVDVLDQCHGNRKAAAEILNLSKSTLYRMMKKHDLL